MDDQPRTSHLHPAPADVSPQPTTSGLVYLFAHELVPPATGRATRSSVKLPCGEDSRVPQQPLANLLFATAFRSLREQGYIILELDTRMWLCVRVTGQEQPQQQGLEGLIMANLPKAGGRDASSVISSCWRDASSDPWNDVVQAAAQAVSGMSQDCAKLAALAGVFGDVAQRWQHFQTTEPVLYKALLDACVRGVVARTQDEPVGTGKSTDRGSGRDLGEVLVAGAALGVGLAVADTDGNSGADIDGVSRGFFDFLGDFFGGLGDFLGDFFDGAGDFFGSDSDGGFDFD